MRKGKRLLCLLLSLLLLFPMSTSALAADFSSVEDFQDSQDFIGEGPYSWCYSEFQTLIQNKVIFGDGTNLLPGRKLSRAEFLAMMLRLGVQSGILDQAAITPSGKGHFVDVRPESWYWKSVNWAAENGLAYGVSADRFDPNGTVTFQEMECFLYRFVEKYHVDLGEPTRFVDYVDIAPWAMRPVQFFGERQIWRDYPDLFSHKDFAARADAVFLIARAAQIGNLL